MPALIVGGGGPVRSARNCSIEPEISLGKTSQHRALGKDYLAERKH